MKKMIPIFLISTFFLLNISGCSDQKISLPILKSEDIESVKIYGATNPEMLIEDQKIINKLLLLYSKSSEVENTSRFNNSYSNDLVILIKNKDQSTVLIQIPQTEPTNRIQITFSIPDNTGRVASQSYYTAKSVQLSELIQKLNKIYPASTPQDILKTISTF